MIGRLRRTVAAALLRGLLSAAMAVRRRPPRRAVVYGRPDSEENSLVAALTLTERYAGEVVLLCEDPAATRRYLDVVSRHVGGRPDAVVLIERTVVTAIRLLLESELVLYTLPVYVAPRPRGRRVHINLWHGTGPKLSSGKNLEIRVGASALTANCEAWGRHTARQLHMPRDAVVLPGNLRQDMLTSADRAAVLPALGLDPDRPLVVWMPTFRTSKPTGVGVMRDGEALSDQGGATGPAALAAAAAAAGVQLVVKPHPLDADSFAGAGLPVLTNDRVWAAGTSLYGFLGASDALLSDYSSTWTDYLQSGRSVGLICPDLASYEAGRGLASPGLRDVAGPLLLDERTIPDFFAAVAAGERFGGDALDVCRSRLGYFDHAERRHLLFDRIAEHAASRLRGHGVALRERGPGGSPRAGAASPA